jgi:PAS domain S-box-containing protein
MQDHTFSLGPGWDPTDVLTAINEALLTGVCITDKTGRFVSVSKGWCDIYGIKAEDALGRHFTMVVPQEGRDQASRLHDEFIAGGIELPQEWNVMRPDGRPLWIRVGAARFHDEAGDPFKVTTVEDITARKAAEQALAESYARLERMNQDKDRLFSIIGHDLRGPFSPILGYADLMETMGESLTVEQALGYAGRIQQAAGHALGLLDNLLDWARLQVEAEAREPVPHDLKRLVDAAVDSVLSVAERKNVTVSVVVPEQDIQVDGHMLTTVIRNLVSNAIKFTPEQGTVTVAGGVDREGHAVSVSVADTGIGMSPEVLSVALGGRGEVSTPGTANEIGSGLGLRIAREMIDRMGGRLDGQSEPGAGSRFTLTIPSPTN